MLMPYVINYNRVEIHSLLMLLAIVSIVENRLESLDRVEWCADYSNSIDGRQMNTDMQ